MEKEVDGGEGVDNMGGKVEETMLRDRQTAGYFFSSPMFQKCMQL